MTTTNYPRSVESMRSIRSEDDRWAFADALLDEVPAGDSLNEFRAIRSAAMEEGVKPYSVSTMRQYRDTAKRWPKADRLDGIKFSAHRAALGHDDPRALLQSLEKAHGVGEVTVAKVKDSLSAASGTTSTSASNVDLRNATPDELLTVLLKAGEEATARAAIQHGQKEAAKRIDFLEAALAESKKLLRRTYNSPLAAATKKAKAETAEDVSSGDTQPEAKRPKGKLRGL